MGSCDVVLCVERFFEESPGLSSLVLFAPEEVPSTRRACLGRFDRHPAGPTARSTARIPCETTRDHVPAASHVHCFHSRPRRRPKSKPSLRRRRTIRESTNRAPRGSDGSCRLRRRRWGERSVADRLRVRRGEGRLRGDRFQSEDRAERARTDGDHGRRPGRSEPSSQVIRSWLRLAKLTSPGRYAARQEIDGGTSACFMPPAASTPTVQSWFKGTR